MWYNINEVCERYFYAWPSGKEKIMNYDILKKNFEKHGFHTAYFETGEEGEGGGAGRQCDAAGDKTE